jgi:hypothetical protein
MNSVNIDQLLSAIRNESVDDKVVAQASERVWTSLARLQDPQRTAINSIRGESRPSSQS